MANLIIGLFGADVLIVFRLWTSHLGRGGKEIGYAIAGLLAVADVCFLMYLRKRRPELSRRPSDDV